MATNFTKKEMLNDLTTSVADEIVRIETHFGSDVVEAIVGGDQNHDELTISQIKHLPITYTLSILYDYGIMGEADVTDDAHFHVTNGLDWVHAQEHADLVGGIPYSVRETIFTALARWALDEGEYLTISGLARLARISERSVRNAASKKEFQTDPQGKHTFVSNDEARRWLAGRRGFIPTKSSSNHIEDIQEVRTRTELGNYLKRIREEKNISIEALANALGDKSSTSDIAHKIESGMEQITFDHAESISKALNISYPTLLAVVIKIYHPDEITEIISVLKDMDNLKEEA